MWEGATLPLSWGMFETAGGIGQMVFSRCSHMDLGIASGASLSSEVNSRAGF